MIHHKHTDTRQHTTYTQRHDPSGIISAFLSPLEAFLLLLRLLISVHKWSCCVLEQRSTTLPRSFTAAGRRLDEFTESFLSVEKFDEQHLRSSAVAKLLRSAAQRDFEHTESELHRKAKNQNGRNNRQTQISTLARCRQHMRQQRLRM